MRTSVYIVGMNLDIGRKGVGMIIEYKYTEHDLRNRCYKCKWLKMEHEWSGYCECPHNKVKERHRSITTRKCSWKNADKV